MFNIIYRYLLSLIILTTNVFAGLTEIKEKLTSSLSSEGFENIRVSFQNSDLFLTYENRLYRFEIDGLFKVFEIIDSSLTNEEIDKIVVVIQNKQIPVVRVCVKNKILSSYMDKEISRKEFADNLETSFDVKKEWSKFENVEATNSSKLKFDLIFKPTYKFEFGLYSKPVRYQLNIAPSLEFSLWKGMSAQYEMTIPLHNDLLPREDTVRTSLAVFNQSFRFTNSFIVSASLGYFTQNRYGLDLDARNYFLNGDLSVALNIGYTGYASFSGLRLYYSDLYLWTGSCGIEYRIQKYDLTLGITAGKFLLGDNTIRVDINRDFGEVQIGFFALRSDEGISNGGINLSIPFLPSKHLKPNFIRLKTNESLAYSYLLKTNTDDLIGLRYNTGYRTSDFIERLNPGFIKNYFLNRL